MTHDKTKDADWSRLGSLLASVDEQGLKVELSSDENLQYAVSELLETLQGINGRELQLHLKVSPGVTESILQGVADGLRDQANATELLANNVRDVGERMCRAFEALAEQDNS